MHCGRPFALCSAGDVLAGYLRCANHWVRAGVGSGLGGCVVIGVWFVGIFLAVVLAYACTEYLFTLFDARGGVLVGRGFALLLIFGVNLLSFLLVLLSACIVISASGVPLFNQAAIACFGAQLIWLGQHLWFYYRDHLRLPFEN
jgi:hypothetical protein